jgi:hypothetical protein
VCFVRFTPRDRAACFVRFTVRELAGERVVRSDLEEPPPSENISNCRASTLPGLPASDAASRTMTSELNARTFASACVTRAFFKPGGIRRSTLLHPL